MRPAARLAALVVALAAGAGLAAEFAGVMARNGSALGTAWALLRYFTVTTNLAVACLFTGLALAREPHPRLVAGAALAIGLVGSVYWILLRDLPLGPGGRLPNLLLHLATPILVPLYWLVATRKGRLTKRDPLLWALYPLGYLVYAIIRAGADGRYPYPFLDLGRLGLGPVALVVTSITASFMAAGFAVVWLDGLLGPGAGEA